MDLVTRSSSTDEQRRNAPRDQSALGRCQERRDAPVAPKGDWPVTIVQRTPSAVAVLRTACTLHICGDDPQHADPFVSIAQAAEMLDAPAGVELQATNALEESLGADDAYLAFLAAIDEQTRRQIDIDAALADFYAWR